jgi:hypothetical protein
MVAPDSSFKKAFRNDIVILLNKFVELPDRLYSSRAGREQFLLCFGYREKPAWAHDPIGPVASDIGSNNPRFISTSPPIQVFANKTATSPTVWLPHKTFFI